MESNLQNIINAASKKCNATNNCKGFTLRKNKSKNTWEYLLKSNITGTKSFSSKTNEFKCYKNYSLISNNSQYCTPISGHQVI